MESKTDLGFGPALRDLMKARGLTFRKLEELTIESDPTGRGLKNAYLNQLANGRSKVSMNGIELIAKALGLDPAYFQEYRAESIRRTFEWDRVDPADLAARLRAMESALNSGAPGLEPLAALAHRLRSDDDQLPPALEHLLPLTEDE